MTTVIIVAAAVVFSLVIIVMLYGEAKSGEGSAEVEAERAKEVVDANERRMESQNKRARDRNSLASWLRSRTRGSDT